MALERKDRWELVLAALLPLLALAATWAWLEARPQQDFQQAIARVEARLGPGELLLLHPPATARFVSLVPAGLPTLAAANLKAEDLEGVAGVWLLTDLPANALKTHGVLKKLYSRSGKARFDDFTLFHFWGPRSSPKEPSATVRPAELLRRR